MGNLSLFLKKNKKVRENTFYAATKSLCDENGEPLKWEIKPVTTSESDEIRADCTIEVQVTGKPGMYRPKTDNELFVARLVAASVVFPDLYNKELQDSYGVTKPEELLKQMLDDPKEYNDFVGFVTGYNGFDESMDDKVAEAKN